MNDRHSTTNPYAAANVESELPPDSMVGLVQALQQAWRPAGTLTTVCGLIFVLMLLEACFLLLVGGTESRLFLFCAGAEALAGLLFLYPVRRLLQFRRSVEMLTGKDVHLAATDAFRQLRLLWRYAMITMICLLTLSLFAVLAVFVLRR